MNDPDNPEYTYAETISWLNRRISKLEQTHQFWDKKLMEFERTILYKYSELENAFKLTREDQNIYILNLSKRIEDLEKNCEVSFAKVEDHVMRILKVIDVQAQSIEKLEKYITK